MSCRGSFWMEYVTETVCREEGNAQSRGDRGCASVLSRFIAVIITGTEIILFRFSRRRNRVCQPIGFHQNRSFTHDLNQAGVQLTKRASQLRHSFTATLVEPAVSHRGFPSCDTGASVSPTDLLTTNLWPRYSIVLFCSVYALRRRRGHFQSQWHSSQLDHRNSLH